MADAKTVSGVALKVLKALDKAGKKGLLGREILKAVYAGKKKPRGNPLAPLLTKLSQSNVIEDDYTDPISEARFKIGALSKAILKASIKK